MLAGCGGGEEATLSVHWLFAANPGGLDAPPHPWEGYGCNDESPGNAECVRLRISACSESSCVSVLDDLENDEAVVPMQNGHLDLDTKWASRRDLLVEAGVYSRDGELLATGETRSASFGDEKTVAITAIPVGAATACGDPIEVNQEQPLSRRAFHTATLLPNGEVLLAGGVMGPIVNTTENGNALEESVEVLDPRSGLHHRFNPIHNQAQGEQGENGDLRRAFHSAAFVGTDPDGRYRIRIFGGIRATGSAGALRVSSTRADTPLFILVAGQATAEPGPPVDILYAPGAKEITITDVTADAAAIPRASFGGFATLEDEAGNVAGYYVGGGLGSWQAGDLGVDDITPVLNTFLTNQNGGTMNASPPELRVGRIGTTAIGIGEDRVLFWGGNAWSAQDAIDTAAAEAALADQIGEVHEVRREEAPTFVAPANAMGVLSTSFHAAALATTDADGTARIVVAGGYLLKPLGTVGIVDFSPVPLYLLSVDPVTSQPTVSGIECRDHNGDSADCADANVFGDVAYATATRIADGRVLIVGGNFVYTQGNTDLQTKYTARAVAGIVTVTGDTAVFEPIDLAQARYGHTATLLPGGAVLIYGGVTVGCDELNDAGDCTRFGDIRPLPPESVYEIYNPGSSFADVSTCEAPAAAPE